MEPRKIVLILGNGFDLDLGLKTRYSDFWKSDYCPKKYPAPLIQHLNQSWTDNLEAVKWYDLENELLKYYLKRKDNPSYPDVINPDLLEYVRAFDPYKYMCDSFSRKDERMEELVRLGYGEYNKQRCWASIHFQEDFKHSPIWRDRKALKLIKEGLCEYLRSIDSPATGGFTVAFQLLLAMLKTVKKGDSVNIYTFNYTPVQMRGIDLSRIPVYYMHGTREDGKIIIGTRDDPQMETNYDFLLKSMNDSYTPPDIVTALKDADEVIIFGHSLGENDRQYFAPFFLRQADFDNPARKEITIFTRDDNSKVEIKRALQKMTNGKLSALYSINQPTIIRTANLQEDRQLMYKFLVDHYSDEEYASEIIEKLIQ